MFIITNNLPINNKGDAPFGTTIFLNQCRFIHKDIGWYLMGRPHTKRFFWNPKNMKCDKSIRFEFCKIFCYFYIVLKTYFIRICYAFFRQVLCWMSFRNKPTVKNEDRKTPILEREAFLPYFFTNPFGIGSWIDLPVIRAGWTNPAYVCWRTPKQKKCHNEIRSLYWMENASSFIIHTWNRREKNQIWFKWEMFSVW
jgi:hypothetical protein